MSQFFWELELYRHSLGSDTRHSLFRAQTERWLEFLVRQDVTPVDSTLDPQFAYAQVLASTAGVAWNFGRSVRYARWSPGNPRTENG